MMSFCITFRAESAPGRVSEQDSAILDPLANALKPLRDSQITRDVMYVAFIKSQVHFFSSK